MNTKRSLVVGLVTGAFLISSFAFAATDCSQKVHVDGYSYVREGKTITVEPYDREPAGCGTSDTTTKPKVTDMVKPVRTIVTKLVETKPVIAKVLDIKMTDTKATTTKPKMTEKKPVVKRKVMRVMKDKATTTKPTPAEIEKPIIKTMPKSGEATTTKKVR